MLITNYLAFLTLAWSTGKSILDRIDETSECRSDEGSVRLGSSAVESHEEVLEADERQDQRGIAVNSGHAKGE